MARIAGAGGVRLALKRETTFGTPPTGNYALVNASTFSLAKSQEFLDVPLLGQGRDPQAPQRDVYNVAGSVAVPLDLRQIGHWLTMLFGPATVTGSGPYTHVFKSGADSLPSYTIERQHNDLTPKLFRLGKGVMANGLNFTAQPSGELLLTIDLIANDITRSGATAAGTPAQATAQAVSQKHGRLKRDGTDLGFIVSATLPYANNLEAVRYLNSAGAIGDIVPGSAAIDGQLTGRLADDALINDAEAEVVKSLELSYVLSANASIAFLMAEAHLSPGEETNEAAGGVEVNYGYRAAQPAGGSALVVTLKNDVATY